MSLLTAGQAKVRILAKASENSIEHSESSTLLPVPAGISGDDAQARVDFACAGALSRDRRACDGKPPGCWKHREQLRRMQP